jgi:SAM-dependent methyltransferase
MHFDVIGVDLSEPLLRRAAQRATLDQRLVRADIRRLPFAPVFDAAVNLFTSFGYFLDESDNQQALHQMARVLRPGGTLLVDLPNPERLRREFEPASEQRINGWRLRHVRTWVDHRIIKRTLATDPQGREHTFAENVRLYEPEEITAMARAAGLADLRLAGSFDGEELTADSPRLIVVGRRA